MYFILNIDNSNSTYSIEPIFNVNNVNDIELNTEELTIEKIDIIHMYKRNIQKKIYVNNI